MRNHRAPRPRGGLVVAAVACALLVVPAAAAFTDGAAWATAPLVGATPPAGADVLLECSGVAPAERGCEGVFPGTDTTIWASACADANLTSCDALTATIRVTLHDGGNTTDDVLACAFAAGAWFGCEVEAGDLTYLADNVTARVSVDAADALDLTSPTEPTGAWFVWITRT